MSRLAQANAGMSIDRPLRGDAKKAVAMTIELTEEKPGITFMAIVERKTVR